MATQKGRGLFKPLAKPNGNARTLVVITIALVSFGTMMVASASEGQATANGGASWSIIGHDLLYLFLGLVCAWFMARIRVDRLVAMAPYLTIFGLVMLVAVPLVGVSANGGKRWLGRGSFVIQPSEFFKFCTVLFMAWTIERFHSQIGDWLQLAIRLSAIAFGVLLIVIEPDIGTASVILIVIFVMLAVAGLSSAMLKRLAGLGLLGILGYALVRTYSFKRLISFLRPEHDPSGTGYQLLQSRIGLGAGGLTGLGLGHSREKWGLLPNPHTDFIFTIIGEELGLIGTLVVLALFMVFLFNAIGIAQKCTNSTYRYIVVGITTWIMFEATVNIASVVGYWAVTGIPLPFFSYGGTALIAELAAVGLLYNIATDTSRTREITIQNYELSTIREMIQQRASTPRPTAYQRGHSSERNY